MNCGSCGTRLNGSERNCPNCGRTISSKPGSRAGDSSLGSGPQGLSPSSAKAPDRRDGLRDAGSSQSDRSARRKKTSKSKPAPSEVSLDDEVAPEPEGGTTGNEKSISAARIRAMVHDRPDRLEDGLSIYTDADANPVGVDFETDIGHIDLLARDDAGGLVAVIISMSHDEAMSGKELVSGALERVGWVRKHVAEPEQEVRAIVLLDQVPDDTSYAAAAVASTVSFKTCRIEVRFADVDL